MIFNKTQPLLSFYFLLFVTSSLAGQARQTNCVNPSAQADLNINAVRARITNGGDLWWDGQDGRYEVTSDENSPNVNPVSAIFAGGLWIGGKDPGGGIKLAAQQYGRGQGNFDYFPGPLTDEGINEDGDDCSKWDRLFVIYRQDIDDYFANLDPTNPNATEVPANLAGWPAFGNPLFEDAHGFTLPDGRQNMAPFWDDNLDGIYDPRDGDYPLFCGDQAVWAIFNDSGAPHAESGTINRLQMEIHLLAYAFASEDSVLHRTTFYEYKVFNRATEATTDFYAGHWIDSDLGCFTNDLMGSSPEHDLFYIYNRNGTDPEVCEGFVSSYGNTAPVNIFQVVNTSLEPEEDAEDPLMHSLVNLYRGDIAGTIPATTEPTTVGEYYNTIRGRWRDGSPITRGGVGYDSDGDETLFVYDGEAFEGAPWRHCSAEPAVADIRQVYSTGPYNLDPGGAASFTLAITTIFGVDYPDGSCPDVTQVFSAAGSIKDFYDDNCGSSAITSTRFPHSPASINLEVFPNPTTSQLSFRVPTVTAIDQVEIVDVSGRQLASFLGAGNELSIDLQAAGLSPGVYLYRLRTRDGEAVTGRVVLME
jgi:hypothetical protein